MLAAQARVLIKKLKELPTQIRKTGREPNVSKDNNKKIEINKLTHTQNNCFFDLKLNVLKHRRVYPLSDKTKEESRKNQGGKRGLIKQSIANS